MWDIVRYLKAYRVYLPVSKTMVVKRDVRYQEDQTLKVPLDHDQIAVPEEELLTLKQ